MISIGSRKNFGKAYKIKKNEKFLTFIFLQRQDRRIKETKSIDMKMSSVLYAMVYATKKSQERSPNIPCDSNQTPIDFKPDRTN